MAKSSPEFWKIFKDNWECYFADKYKDAYKDFPQKLIGHYDGQLLIVALEDIHKRLEKLELTKEKCPQTTDITKLKT